MQYMRNKDKESIDILIVDFLNRRIDSDNLQILNRWINVNEENRIYFNQLRDTWMLSSAYQYADPDINSSYNLFTERIKQQKPEKRKPMWKKYILYAAAVVALLLIIPSVTNIINEKSSNIYTELNIPRAAKLNITLPDGSTAWINADSKLVYSSDFGIKNRNIIMEGEGYFEVVPGKIPFIVSTDSTQVKVLGTKFNIRNYKRDLFVKVSLFEGKVLFLCNEEEVYLKPSEIVEWNKNSKSFKKIDSKIEYANQWINNHLFFDETSFEDIAFELERQFNVNIHFKSEELKKLIFYGDFAIEANNLSEILKIMSSTNKFQYQYRIEHNEVYISEIE